MAPKNIAPLLVGFLCLMVLFTVSEAGNFKLISKFVKQCVIEGGFVKKLSDAIACGDCAALCSAKCPGGDFRIGFPVPDCRFLPCPPVLINSICTLVGPAKNHLTRDSKSLMKLARYSWVPLLKSSFLAPSRVRLEKGKHDYFDQNHN
ncbi:hypothetical protein C5167_051205 [Papaver somniferum]|uniref:4Fe-4S ferredoxin-type domain-containing protein n=1 Tax=Papaver somniferum TaxID=3469 RepID=A0A4Y7KQU5_PAPSO|nr:hypothetical protein C5167_051205 [Papaver somniferum]